LQGQLGTGSRPLHQYPPKEIFFSQSATPDSKDPITRITASAYNSAAFTKKEKMYVWGSAADDKLGIGKLGRNISAVDEPFLTDFRAKKVAFQT